MGIRPRNARLGLAVPGRTESLPCRHLTEKKVRLINPYDRAILARLDPEGRSGLSYRGLWERTAKQAG